MLLFKICVYLIRKILTLTEEFISLGRIIHKSKVDYITRYCKDQDIRKFDKNIEHKCVHNSFVSEQTTFFMASVPTKVLCVVIFW